MLTLLRRQPVAVAGVVQAVLALVVAFGVRLSTGQTGGILAVVGAGLALVVRSQVSPTALTPSADELANLRAELDAVKAAIAALAPAPAPPAAP